MLSSISPYWVKFTCSKCGGDCRYSSKNKVYDLDYIRPLYKCSKCQTVGQLYEI